MDDLNSVVAVRDGIVTTLSTDVAAVFGKQHKNVIRDIENIVANLSESRRLNFELCFENNALANGKPIKRYRLTRDGFMILAMGFTGEKAMEFKWQYIDAFNAMEKKLREGGERSATITPAEQLQIQQAVARRAKTSSANYQTIYRAIKVRFQIPRYNELPTRQFAECLKFIDAVDLKVPEAKTAAAPVCENPFTPEELAASPEKPPKGYTYQVSAKFLDDQRTFVYYWRYLFRRELELFEEFLYRTESPRASRFHEAVHNLDLMRTEDQLRRLGFPMDELPCYQHYVRRLTAA
jgi:Rha family phage regulatory protein